MFSALLKIVQFEVKGHPVIINFFNTDVIFIKHLSLGCHFRRLWKLFPIFCISFCSCQLPSSNKHCMSILLCVIVFYGLIFLKFCVLKIYTVDTYNMQVLTQFSVSCGDIISSLTQSLTKYGEVGYCFLIFFSLS